MAVGGRRPFCGIPKPIPGHRNQRRGRWAAPTRLRLGGSWQATGTCGAGARHHRASLAARLEPAGHGFRGPPLMDHHCLVCGEPTHLVIDLGRMPLADAFRHPDDLTIEFFYDLKIVRCTVCTMVEIEQPVAPELMFHARYPFFTGTSRAMTAHFENFGAQVLEMLAPSRSRFVVELGGNDGTLLSLLAKRGVR